MATFPLGEFGELTPFLDISELEWNVTGPIRSESNEREANLERKSAHMCVFMKS